MHGFTPPVPTDMKNNPKKAKILKKNKDKNVKDILYVSIKYFDSVMNKYMVLKVYK